MARSLRSVIFAVPPLAAAAIVAALVLYARISARVGDPPELYIADVWVALAFPVVGAWLVMRGLRDRVGFVLLASSALSVVALGAGWATYDALDGELHAVGSAMAWLASWLWTPYLLVPTLVPALHVDPQLRGRGTRAVTLATLAVLALATVASAFAPGPISEASDVANPLGLRGAGWLRVVAMGGAALSFLVLAPVSVAVSAWHVRRTPPSDVPGGGVVLAAGVTLIAMFLADGLTYPWNDVVTAVALSLLPLAVVVAVREAQIRLDVRRENEQLRRAREDERRRLRRELHDGLGPELAGIRLRLAAASADVPDAVRNELDEATGRLATVAGDVRRLVDGLRPVALEEVGLAEAVRSRGALLSTDTCTVACTVDDLPPCDAAVELAAYQIASEAMANAAQHAEASRIHVTLSAQPEGLAVEVSDDGRGGAVPRDGSVGFGSMRARADEVGGSLEITSTSSGTSVRACLPTGASA